MTALQQELDLFLLLLKQKQRHRVQLMLLGLHAGIDQRNGEWCMIFVDKIFWFCKYQWMGSFKLVQKLLGALEPSLMRLPTVG